MTDPALAPPDANGGGAAVFVSYSRDDQKRAIPVIDALKKAGFSVWWDGLIGGGERFLHTTEAALEGARAVVVLWSARSVASHWVRDEATRGRDRHCLVPLSLDGSEPPLGFRQFQVIDFSKWRGQTGAPECERLIDAVSRLCAGDTPPVIRTPTRLASPSRRAMVLGAGATALVAGGAGAWWAGLIGDGNARANSVAVLPFENLSGDTDQAYFADGLSAELRAALSRNVALKVAAQTSSDAARSLNLDARGIAARLGVAFLLDGNVRLASSVVRISAELIDGQTGLVSWAKSYERPIDDVLAVQGEIATSVTAALTSVIAASNDGKGKAPGGTSNVAAFDAYLRGRDLYNNAGDEAGERAALAQFDAAIALDPEFAAAHSARARSLTVIANQYGTLSETRRYYDLALQYARRAVALAPEFADAQSTLGSVLFQARLEVAQARAPFDLSYRLGAGDASVIGRYALYCAATGQHREALDAAKRAAELDPLNPLTQRALGFVHYAARRYREAIAAVETALAANSPLGNSNAIIGASKLMLGDRSGARVAFARESNALYRDTGLAIVDHLSGRTQEAAAARARVVSGLGIGQLTFYQQAQIAAQWGETAAALNLLDQAYRNVDSGLIYARNDPMLDPLRQRSEFIRLLSTLGFQ